MERALPLFQGIREEDCFLLKDEEVPFAHLQGRREDPVSFLRGKKIDPHHCLEGGE